MVNTEKTRPDAAAPVRRRLDAREREEQIVAGATEFFARRGLDAQMRELAAELGIAHTLLYHYFPTKRQLIERVYEETIAGRWESRWEKLLDDARRPVPDKLQAFYREYLPAILTPEWLRILVHSSACSRAWCARCGAPRAAARARSPRRARKRCCCPSTAA
jgi:AcrR family transcriptional regulator